MSILKNLGVGNHLAIKKWCDEMKIKKYEILDNGEINIKGSVYINSPLENHELAYQFNEIKGNFSVMFPLKNFKNCPRKVGGSFFVRNDLAKNLIGLPERVGLMLRINNWENLESLEGSPEKIGGDFYCCNCQKLKSLEGAPKSVRGNFTCYNNGKEFTEEEIRKNIRIKGEIRLEP